MQEVHPSGSWMVVDMVEWEWKAKISWRLLSERPYHARVPVARRHGS